MSTIIYPVLVAWILHLRGSFEPGLISRNELHDRRLSCDNLISDYLFKIVLVIRHESCKSIPLGSLPLVYSSLGILMKKPPKLGIQFCYARS